MEASKKRQVTRIKKKAHIRKKLWGTEERPRVCVFRSSKHIYVQAIDDGNGKTLAQTSTLASAVKTEIGGNGGNVDAATKVGKAFGDVLKAKGINQVIFDRNGYLYHGRVKNLADGIRETGIQF